MVTLLDNDQKTAETQASVETAQPPTARPASGSAHLTAYAWLSVATALVTMGLKFWAWNLTGSVSIFSDAMECTVNLSAALFALWMLTLASSPPDDEHCFGHEKAEYFSIGVEGMMIVGVSLGILAVAIPRLIHVQPVESFGVGAALSTLASGLNWIVALILLRAGRKHRSVTLEADGQHLMTDVWFSAAVLLGVGLVWLTGWQRLDPLIACLVAALIVRTGATLMRKSAMGLLDSSLPAPEVAKLREVLDSFAGNGITYHALRTRQAGRAGFADVHILVPGEWTVARGHDVLEQIEKGLTEAVPGLRVMTHLEPIDEPASFQDIELDHEH